MVPSSQWPERRLDDLGLGSEHVVPVVPCGPEPLDGRERGDHGGGHGIAGGVGVEAAVNLRGLADQWGEPGRIRSGAGSGEAAMPGMKQSAAEGVDGGFAKDEGGECGAGYGEEAVVFAGAGRHAPPLLNGGAAQFCANGDLVFAAEQEDGIGAAVSVEVAGTDE